MSPQACSEFCLGKGLDLAGVRDGAECRCGASALNGAVWHGMSPRESLAFQPGNLAPEGASASCAVLVQRFAGPYEDGGVPFGLTRTSAQDISYIDSIVVGKDIALDMEEDGVPVASELPAGENIAITNITAAGTPTTLVHGDDEAPGFARPCYPHNCGPAGGPWLERRETPPAEGGDDGRWADYAVIRYFFDDDVDDERRGAFRQAVQQWRAVTCVDFVEEPGLRPPPALEVGVYDPSSCYASDIGFPGDQAYQLINMGWCNSERYVGNIMHELGHVLGMNHEQKRPDAINAYHGHGPFLVVHWEHVPEEWKDQYQEDADSYVGSASDGPGDPHEGYASYDFASIMHYPASDHFDTVPAEARELTGNRHQLSSGDIGQILDAYQCRAKGRDPAAAEMNTAEVVAQQDDFQVMRKRLALQQQRKVTRTRTQ